MATFTVTWTIDIDAKNARDAAEQALAIQRDAGSDAVVFQVDERIGKVLIKPNLIDLAQEG